MARKGVWMYGDTTTCCLLHEQRLERRGARDPRLARPGDVAGDRAEARIGNIAWRRPRAHALEEARVQVQIHGGHIADACEHQGC